MGGGGGRGGEGVDNLRHQTKRILQNLGTLRKKITNLKIFEQFEYLPDMLGTFQWQKP